MSALRYSPEFKEEAVKQVVDRGYNVPEVAAAEPASRALCQRGRANQPVDAGGPGRRLRSRANAAVPAP